jgi:hypothetical protein
LKFSCENQYRYLIHFLKLIGVNLGLVHNLRGLDELSEVFLNLYSEKMADNYYKGLVKEWIPIYENILADMEYNQNLPSHMISIEIMHMKVIKAIIKADFYGQNTEKLKSLVFLVFSLQQEILALKPDSMSWQREILSLRRETFGDWKALLLQGDKLG